MKKLILILLFPFTIMASEIVIVDPLDATVPDRAIAFYGSAHTPNFEGNPDAVINPDLTLLKGIVPWGYWKRSGGVIVEMSQAEKDALDAKFLADEQTEIRDNAVAEADKFSELGLDIRAMIENHNKRDNYIINRLVEIQDTLVAIRDQTFGTQARQNIDVNFPTLATATRPRSDAVQDYKDDISLGNVDT